MMAKRKRRKLVSLVRVAWPAGRHAQLRYKDAEGAPKKISAESSDPIEVERQRVLLEARLLAGDYPRERTTRPIVREGDEIVPHHDMTWDDYSVFYYRRYLSTLRRKARSSARSSLAIAGRLLKFHFENDLHANSPVTLGHMLKRAHLNKIRELLEQGKFSKRLSRSKFTVVSVMKAVIAALNWAAEEEYIEAVPKVRLPKLSKLKASKGRPIDETEFQAMLDATAGVVGEKEAPSWQFVLRGLWESGFRIGELMQFGWDIPNAITPVWRRGKLPVLHFPAEQQKNDTEEEIPLLPGLEKLLVSVPMDDRTGWIFDPKPVKGGRRPVDRVSEEWASKIISRIGKRAKVIVHQELRGSIQIRKYASAHDVRRGLAERLFDAGIPAELVQIILRHASLETTRKHYAKGAKIQRQAERLRRRLDLAERREERKRKKRPVE